MTDRDLLRRIERSAGQRANYKQLVRELGLGGGRERRLLLEQLARLTARGILTKVDREQWALARAAQTRDALVSGRLDLHRDGFGFVRPLQRGADREQDIFIPPDALEGAMQGDTVLVELLPARGDSRRAGRIARILERRNPTVVGIFHYGHGSYASRESRSAGNFVSPLDERMTQPIVIPPGLELPETQIATTPHRVLGQQAVAATEYDDLEGLVVNIEITDWPTPTRAARGRVMEILGERDAFGVDVEILIRKHHLPHTFPDRALEEARHVAVPPAQNPTLLTRRQDFRGLPIVTIDGETARDFDDAVFVRALNQKDDGNDGYELQVHIADVAEYVRPDTALNLEARLRGNSVYFPDRAIPMLPAELSTDVCSLRPGEDRLVLSCILQIASDGTVRSAEICEGVIRSARRMTYTQVHAILDGDATARAEFADLIPEFERMHTLARLLNTQRERRGSIDFDLPEPVIQFDEHGQMNGIVRSERSWANRLIEEFMLAANEAVATWIETLGVPSIYRIHEKPDPKRIVNFEEIAAGFGYSLGLGPLPVRKMELRGDRRERMRRNSRGSGGGQKRTHEIPEDILVTPQMYQKLTARLAGKPEERILTYLMLRSLKQARYSEENVGHFALAAPCYTHFTSPIRRYPDLIVHRITKELLRAGIDGNIEFSQRTKASPWPPKYASLTPHLPHPQSSAAVSIAPPMEIGELAAIAQECSESERRAADAERELIEWKKVRFMQDRIGEEFSAIVLNVTRYGLFVELDDLFVEGLVPIDSLMNDRYTYRENTHQIMGEYSGHLYSAGDRVRVILDRIDAMEHKLQFAVMEESILNMGKPSGKQRVVSVKKKDRKSANPKKTKKAKRDKRKRR
ncbi:MAG TPA: RNB domain-containing ribonuclease [Acidobacteriaceae bacterium]|jgi:ribonuclease R|nr:RNB domain-containing ribonuclease [Acidobacteriaceae bacterium]